MRRPLFALALVLLPAALPAQNNAAFIIRLGKDTSAVERFTFSGNRIEGEGLVRQPRTGQRRFVFEIGPNGRPTRAEVTQLRPGAPATEAPLQRIVATFSAESVVVETRRDTGAPQTRRAAAAGAVVPSIGGASGSFIAYEQVARRLHRERGADSISVPVGLGTGTFITWRAGRISRDSIWIYDGNNRFHIHVDRDGRILHAEPVSGTQQFSVERVAGADIAALATAFAARDAQGQNLGQLSTRDTVRAVAGGANLWIDYGRPAKRGRVIFGSNIVPWNQVWRTGANAATQFRTDRDLEIQGIRVPAGIYSLWTIPSPGGWKLVFNTQVGQWGTSHDPARDTWQFDLRTSTLTGVVERFTIAVVPEGQGGLITFEWDTTRAALAFTVR